MSTPANPVAATAAATSAPVQIPTKFEGMLDYAQLTSAITAFGGASHVTLVPGNLESGGTQKDMFKVTGISAVLHGHQLHGVAAMESIEQGEAKGGMLCDDMGPGKTLEVITLLHLARRKALAKNPNTKLKPDLIVVPAAVLHQWFLGIEKFLGSEKEARKAKAKSVSESSSSSSSSSDSDEMGEDDDEKLKVIKFTTGNWKTSDTRDRRLNLLKSNDIILTTYETVAKSLAYGKKPKPTNDEKKDVKNWNDYLSDAHKSRDALHRMQFEHIVLDESQAIKNHTTARAVACFALDGNYRWLVSGTPLMDRVIEGFSYLKFLRVDGIVDKRDFTQKYMKDQDLRPLEKKLAALMVRRLKASTAGLQV